MFTICSGDRSIGRTICDHLHRARTEQILNEFSRLHLRFF